MKNSVVGVVYFVLLLLTTAPILSVTAASAIAHSCGARLDEGGVHPCILWGHDIGPLLYDMFVSGWFMLITIPVDAIAILAFTVILLFARFRS